jgi:hypothetical protein
MQHVERTKGNNTFVCPIHRSLCRISVKILAHNRNQLILIHVPEISLALTECNPHITRVNALVGPHSGRQDFLQFLPSGRHKYCGLRRRVAGETVRHDTASQPAMECLEKPLWEPLISHCLIKTSRQHARYHAERYLDVSRRRPWCRTFLRRQTVPTEASSTRDKAAIIRDTIKGTRCTKTLRVTQSF